MGEVRTRMMIDEKDHDLDRDKEVKVKIPVGYHVRLHSIKVLTGKQISTAVTEALELYFEDMQRSREADARPEEVPGGDARGPTANT